MPLLLYRTKNLPYNEMNYKEVLKMTMIFEELLELKSFAEETRRMIEELAMYRTLNIVGDDMFDGMESEIIKRLTYTDVKIKEIFESLDTGY